MMLYTFSFSSPLENSLSKPLRSFDSLRFMEKASLLFSERMEKLMRSQALEERSLVVRRGSPVFAEAVRTALVDWLKDERQEQKQACPESQNQRPGAPLGSHLPKPSPVHGEMHENERDKAIGGPSVQVSPLMAVHP